MPLALVISIAVHIGLGVLLGQLVAGGGDGRASPFVSEPLRATLTSPAQRFAVPEAQAPTPDALAPSVAPDRNQAALPVPLKQGPPSRPGLARAEGQVIVNLLAHDEPVPPAMQNVIERIYPGVVRAAPDFEVMPRAAYPAEALQERRQAYVVVLVVVREDGSVELAQGTYEDPLFAPSIRAALAGAKARPPIIDGQPRPIWSPMSFTFEVVGGP